MLEPCEGKLSCTVLRGESGSNTANLLDKPSDIEQREGRIIRQGNQNKKVHIYRYVTEQTFDAYSWQIIENKQKFIGQIMTNKVSARSCEDLDETALSYAEVKALASGNPQIKEKMDLDTQVARLKLLKSNYLNQLYQLEDNITSHYPNAILLMDRMIYGLQADMETYQRNKEVFSMKIKDIFYYEKKEAGTALLDYLKNTETINSAETIGEYMGFPLWIDYDTIQRSYILILQGDINHSVALGGDASGNFTRIQHVLDGMVNELESYQARKENTLHQLETAKIEVKKAFPQEQELKSKMDRLTKLNRLLETEGKQNQEVEKTAVKKHIMPSL